MPHGSPDWLMPTVPVNITLVEGDEPDINVEDSPIAETWGWDPTGDGQWRKILVNADGKLIIDPSEIFEDEPTNNEHGKAPTSNWAHDHKEAANIHHTPPEAGDFQHNDLSGRGPNDHHTPPGAGDFEHNDLGGIGESDHHIKTTLHTDITDFHNGVQATLSCRGNFIEKASQLGTNTQIMEMVVFNSKLYGIGFPDGILLEWNGVDAWVQKAAKYGTELGGYALCVFNGKLYTGTRNKGYLLEWNDTDAWVLVAGTLGGAQGVFGLVVFNGKLYAGLQYSGQLGEWNGVDAWVKKADQYAAEISIRRLLVFNNKLYGGTNPNGLLLEWDETDAWINRSQTTGIQRDIESMCEHNSKLYAGSDNDGKLYEWNEIDELVTKAPQFMGQTYIDSLISFGGMLYGGSYNNAYLLAWNGVDAWGLASICDGVESSIGSLCEFNSKLYCGTQVLAKLFLFDQLTLCEFQTDNDFHPSNIHNTSLITAGIFPRARLAESTAGVIFYDAGDKDDEDFYIGDFTLDNNWHDLDLSGFIPVGTISVYLKIVIRATADNKYFQIRKNGYSTTKNCMVARSYIANVVASEYGIIFCDSNRKIEYYGQSGTFNVVRVTILGWWK